MIDLIKIYNRQFEAYRLNTAWIIRYIEPNLIFVSSI